MVGRGFKQVSAQHTCTVIHDIQIKNLLFAACHGLSWQITESLCTPGQSCSKVGERLSRFYFNQSFYICHFNAFATELSTLVNDADPEQSLNLI